MAGTFHHGYHGYRDEAQYTANSSAMSIFGGSMHGVPWTTSLGLGGSGKGGSNAPNPVPS